MTVGGPYLTLAEAAELARVSPKRLRNLMADGTLQEGVHFTRPRGVRPRFRRPALVDWLEGRDGPTPARPKRGRGSRLNLALLQPVRGGNHGL